jgi:UDP-N-acetylglucosamine--N-acetylmuramyl-(pentapeptide) pyrophosphoryl-undecaprenol N-acetylglucosamine transferase
MTKVIISGGGTGGHIFPAIAIAGALRQMEPGIEILFVGANGRMEMEKVPAAGYRITGLPVTGFQRRITWKNLVFPFRLSYSLLKAKSIIRTFSPDVVIGVGGYASGPTLRMAISRGIPTLIQEQNSFPGVTNRILAPKVDRICVAYQGMDKYFPSDKIILTGNPVRNDIVSPDGDKAAAYAFFGLNPGLKTLLVTGGSLGSGTINDSILIAVGKNMDSQIQILWQTGKNYYEKVLVSLADEYLPNVKVYPFIDRMDLAYTIADAVVSRAGAIAISELAIAGKPAILIPSPNVAEDHQTKNARALEAKGAAILIPDAESREKLFSAVKELMKNDGQRKTLSDNIRSFAMWDSAQKIASEALALSKSDKKKR